MRRVLLATTCISLVSGPLLSGEAQAGGVNERPAIATGTVGVNPAMTVDIDPETGALLDRAPNATTSIAVDPADASSRELEQVESREPGGGVMVDVRGRFQAPITVLSGNEDKPVLGRGAASSGPPK